MDAVAKFLYEAMMTRMEEGYGWPRTDPTTGARFTWEGETEECKSDWRYLAAKIIERGTL